VKPVEPTERTANRPSSVAAMALVLAALDLAPSPAHALEAPPRLARWPIELWRETTVSNGQFAVLGVIGGPLTDVSGTCASVGWDHSGDCPIEAGFVTLPGTGRH
jgi:hypothetical protein